MTETEKRLNAARAKRGSKLGPFYVSFMRTSNSRAMAFVAKTVELVENTILADYDKEGTIIGVEIISPTGVCQGMCIKAGGTKKAKPKDEARSCQLSHEPNAVTRKAIRDAKLGKNLTAYKDVDDMFEKLGIKRGTAK